MSDFVRLGKTGIIAFEWDGDKQENIPYTPVEAIMNLRSRCELEDGVTLGDIFKAVDADPKLMEFIAHYSWCGPIKEFHEEAKLPRPEVKEATDFVKDENSGMMVPANEGESDPIVELTVESYAEFHKNYKDKNGPPSFEGVWWHFGGTGKSGTNYSVSYTPMNEIAHVPVIIKPLVHFNKDFLPMESLPPAEITISLLDFLDAIYFDISFHGGPKDNRAFVEELKGMMEEIDNGTAKLVPFEFHDEEDSTDSSPDPQK